MLVVPGNDFIADLARALGLDADERPIAEITLRAGLENAVTAEVTFVVLEGEAGAIRRVLRHYRLRAASIDEGPGADGPSNLLDSGY